MIYEDIAQQIVIITFYGCVDICQKPDGRQHCEVVIVIINVIIIIVIISAVIIIIYCCILLF